MTILDRLYASSGPEVINETLQINIGQDTHYLTTGWDDFDAALESGETVTYTASGLDIALPARNEDGTQDLKFALCNIDGSVSTAIRKGLSDLSTATLTYRCYVDTDYSAPAGRPYSLTIKGGYWTADEAQITGGYLNVLDTAWPRRFFTLPDYPGLRHIS